MEHELLGAVDATHVGSGGGGGILGVVGTMLAYKFLGKNSNGHSGHDEITKEMAEMNESLKDIKEGIAKMSEGISTMNGFLQGAMTRQN